MLQKTENSGYFKKAEFEDITDDVQINERIKEKTKAQEAYGYAPEAVIRNTASYYGFAPQMANLFNSLSLENRDNYNPATGIDHEKQEIFNNTRQIFKTYSSQFGILDPLCALACSSNNRFNYEHKYNSEKIIATPDSVRNCHNLLYGTELWPHDRLVAEAEKLRDRKKERRENENMIDLVKQANETLKNSIEPVSLDYQLAMTMLQDEIDFLQDQLMTHQNNMALPVQEIKYRESKIDEEPLAKNVLTLNQLLNYPDRAERPSKILVLVRGIPGSERHRIGNYIKKNENAIGGNNAATIKILSMAEENKFQASDLETERDMVRALTNEHERLEDFIIYDCLRQNQFNNIIYVVEGIFYRKVQFQKIVHEAKKNGFTVLFAHSKPPNLKDKQCEKNRNANWFKKCQEMVQEVWKPYLNFLVNNFELLGFEEEIFLDVWEIFEEKFENWLDASNLAVRNKGVDAEQTASPITIE